MGVQQKMQKTVGHTSECTPRHVFQMNFWRHKPNVRSIFHRHLSNCRDGPLGEPSLRLKSKKKNSHHDVLSWSLGLGHLLGLVPEFSHGLHLGVPVPGTLDIWINFNAEICGAEVCCITAPGTSTEPTDWMTPPARAETLPGPVLPGSGEIRATSQWSPKNRRKIG